MYTIKVNKKQRNKSLKQMRIKSRITYLNPIPVEWFNTVKLSELINRMKNKMIAENGIGIAAIQIGEPYRIFIAGGITFINPEPIEILSNEMEERAEGCLSVPGKIVNIKRYKTICITAYNTSGYCFTLAAQDMLARIIQHEMDHLDGKLITDYIV